MTPRTFLVGALFGFGVVLAVPSAAVDAAKRHVFLIMMENKNASDVYCRDKAPYLHELMQKYAYAENFVDVLPSSVPSEPHYVWLEAGTNRFDDHTFASDREPSARNSTASTAHFVNLLEAKEPTPLTWATYQEGINEETGRCPIESEGLYAAKHDPFVFFQDVSGSPPSKTSPRCVEHTRPLAQLAKDLKDVDDRAVSNYNLITPDLCNDMHGKLFHCFASVSRGDTWLRENLPPLIQYAQEHEGVIFITWDETEGQRTQPFVVVGPHVKPGPNPTRYDLTSVLKSLEEIFGVGPLPSQASDSQTNDLSALFEPGFFP